MGMFPETVSSYIPKSSRIIPPELDLLLSLVAFSKWTIGIKGTKSLDRRLKELFSKYLRDKTRRWERNERRYRNEKIRRRTEVTWQWAGHIERRASKVEGHRKNTVLTRTRTRKRSVGRLTLKKWQHLRVKGSHYIQPARRTTLQSGVPLRRPMSHLWTSINLYIT